jgi:YD repeat-containing protein
VSWLGLFCETCGIARVRLDGTVTLVDTFAPLPRSAGVVFQRSGLAPGSHTLVIEVTGTPNPSSAGMFIVVDAFDVTDDGGAPPPTGDTTPPTVTITAPSSGATVSSTVTVTATASDNVGVAGVQFFVGTTPLGAEDTSSPYSAAWNTTTAANGSHRLTAVARDAAGNRRTSAEVTVTVSNASPPPPSSTVRRFEETDPSISFTPAYTGDLAGIWKRSTSHAWSGDGNAAATNIAGTQARFTFTGPSVSWIGFKGPQAGVARVSLDGVVVREALDLISSTEEVRVPVLTLTGLDNTTHTLTIDVLTDGPFIVVDAFDVPAPAVERVQETDSSVVFSPGWTQLTPGFKWSGDTAMETTTGGPQVTFTFDGTGVAWVGFRGTQGGIARVVLDGVALPEVDTFAAIETQQGVQAEVWKKTGLPSGRHTLTIEATGRKNAQATAVSIVVDAFEVTR